MKNENTKKYRGRGRPKGVKNKTTIMLAFKGFTDADKEKVFQAAMKLVDSGNAMIIGKLLDKMIPDVEISKNDFKQEEIEALRKRAAELMKEQL